MARRQKTPTPQPPAEPAEIEGDHLRKRTIECPGELIRPKPAITRTDGKRLRQAKPVPLPVAELSRRSQHQPRFAQADRRQQPDRIRRSAADALDQDTIAQVEPVGIDHAAELRRDRAHKARLTAPALTNEQHNVSGANVQVETLRHDVPPRLKADPEMVHHRSRGETPFLRDEFVSHTDLHPRPPSVLLISAGRGPIEANVNRIRSCSQEEDSAAGYFFP